MDLETSTALAKVLEYIANSLGAAIESNGENVTEYMKTLGSKIVMYKSGIAFLWEAVAALLIVIGVIMLIVSIVKQYEVTCIVSIVFIAIGVIMAIVNAYTIIACKTFPEKVILDYIELMYTNLKAK